MMTETEQQIALCEWAFGIKDHGERDGYFRYSNGKGLNYSDPSEFPNTNSLDVLHEMEMKLANEGSLLDKYVTTLFEVHARHERDTCPELIDTWEVVLSSANIRREALLRTLGLWKE